VTRRPRRLLLVPVVLLTGACFQGQRVIKVNADGSGTIVDTLVPGDQLKAMMAAKGKSDADADQKKKREAAAAAFGPGVTFVSEETTPDGLKSAFAFKDIRTIKVEICPGPGGEKEPGQASEPPLTFRFARQGAKSTLTVVQPQPPKPEPSAETPEGMPDMAAGMWTMMKGMLKGLKLKTVVEVGGAVTRTNSRYAQGPVVTLLEMDFDQIAADDANFKRFTKAGDDPATLDPKLLQGIKGVKVNPDPEVVIEFAGK